MTVRGVSQERARGLGAARQEAGGARARQDRQAGGAQDGGLWDEGATLT